MTPVIDPRKTTVYMYPGDPTVHTIPKDIPTAPIRKDSQDRTDAKGDR